MVWSFLEDGGGGAAERAAAGTRCCNCLNGGEASDDDAKQVCSLMLGQRRLLSRYDPGRGEPEKNYRGGGWPTLAPRARALLRRRGAFPG